MDELQPVFVIEIHSELNDEQASTIQSQIYTNQNLITWWTNFDTPFDFILPLMVLISAICFFFSSKVYSENREEIELIYQEKERLKDEKIELKKGKNELKKERKKELKIYKETKLKSEEEAKLKSEEEAKLKAEEDAKKEENTSQTIIQNITYNIHDSVVDGSVIKDNK